MPSLFLFKRRWLAGSDDLVLPGILLSLTHFILFLLTSIFVISSSELQYWSSFDPDVIADRNANQTSVNLARCANELRSFTLFFVALLITATLLELIMTWFSMKGTVLDPAPRKPIQFIVYVRSGLGIVEVCFSIVVAVHLKEFWDICDPFHYFLATETAIITINFLLLLIVLLILVCIFDSTGGTFYRVYKAKDDSVARGLDIEDIMLELDEKTANSWKRSLRRCCCCVRDTSNTNVALEEASHLLRDLFRRLDVVPSDILAGLILLRHKQQCVQLKKVAGNNEIREFFCGRPITKDVKYIDPNDPKEAEQLKTMIYYCNYAVAIYGSLFYLVDHPFTGLCNIFDQCLCKGRCCCAGPGARVLSTVVEKDPCCGWETSAVVRSLGGELENVEIAHVSWRNDLYEQPFIVSVDHERRAIVVAVRGTLSELDALTDIVATPEVIPVPGNNGSWKCHKGILQGALYLHDRLISDGVLSKAFNHDPNKETEQYKLVLVGHSLGAGVVSVLSILLRPTYPDLHCYSFAPPGGLLSQSAVDLSRDFISTAVFGKDLVIRTSIHQLHRMKRDVLELLQKSNSPKYKIVFGDKRVPPDAALPGEPRAAGGDTIGPHISEGALKHDVLYPPGRIFHIVYKSKTRSGFGCGRDTRSYFAIEANNAKDFDEILVSHNMLNHHWPQELLKAMKKVLTTNIEICDKKEYENSATIPSHARPPNQQQGDSRDHPIIKEPNRDKRPSNNTNENNLNSAKRDEVEVEVEVEVLTETTRLLPSTEENSFPAVEVVGSDNESNSNQPTSRELDVEDAQVIEADPQSAPPPSPTMLGRFKSYVDAVLPEASDIASPDHLDATNETKKLRSQSMPSSSRLDQNTIERAQFEPNLIPKPPRSHSMLRQQTADPAVTVDDARSASRDDDVASLDDASLTS